MGEQEKELQERIGIAVPGLGGEVAIEGNAEDTQTDIHIKERSVINIHLGDLEDKARLLHDRLSDVLGPDTRLQESDEKRQECSPLCEKIIIIQELIEAIHHRLEV